ncbi:hypothetical protein QIA36_05105 (plasmid) [Borreliella yangtzensis]|uniref:hypothetical protein n=1 Tax=Borreliella yangtzensis TaxID=683292 RepID=UPI003B21B8FD
MNQNNNKNNYNNGNKYIAGKTEIQQYFRDIVESIFNNKNSNDEIYQCLKNELLNNITKHFEGLIGLKYNNST